MERPFHSFHREMLKWFDHWLRGVDTDIMREPPVKYWVMGENRWRSADNWPLPDTQWTKLYLNNWERLSAEPFTPSSVDKFIPPDVVRSDAADSDQDDSEASLPDRSRCRTTCWWRVRFR